MPKILGYADRISAAPGETIRVMVSCNGLIQYNARLVRVIQGDVNPSGPGYQEELVPMDLGGPFNGRYQSINIGSYAVVQGAPPFNTETSLGMRAIIWPTTPGDEPQTILSQVDHESGCGFKFFIDINSAISIEIKSKGRWVSKVSTGVPIIPQRWYLVTGSYDIENSLLTVSQRPLQPCLGMKEVFNVSHIDLTNMIHSVADVPIMIAAASSIDKPSVEHFNGRIEEPCLFSHPISVEKIENSVDTNCDDLIAAWDFSVGISTDKIIDISGNEFHGTLVNLPTRGVCGHLWNGEEHCWKNKPKHYAAIHFHNDDLYDCSWETDFKIRLPGKFSSGVYAIHLYSGNEEYYIPIIVRPPRGTTTSSVVLLLPTASYIAYANNRIGIDIPETEIVCGRLIQLNSYDLYMQSHPEIGLSFYDLHNDGSGVFYSSRLRPIVNMQPKHIGHLGGVGSNLWQFNADTHILGWLEKLGNPFDVITDEDLEAEGLTILANYSTVITGTHPEYYSIKMLDSLQSFVNGGGRLMYLGGNGFYWRISYHPTLPGVIECRKSEDGIRAFAPLPGEYYSSFIGEYTGLWRRNGRPPNELVGIGMVSQGFDHSSPYVLTESSCNPRVSFVFKGVKGPVIGDYGLSGGGAAGLELDATNHALGTPPHVLVLATSNQHTDMYLMTPEDMDDPAPGLGGSEAEIIRAEMVFFETAGGGAVFSTGSIAWAGSLSHNNYDNDVATISTNVLMRFLDATPFPDAP